MDNILVTICGRGGSKGIPGKNIKSLNGLPLIAYSIQTGKKFCGKYGADMTLSTDSDDIKSSAMQFGLSNSYHRPAELSTDSVGKIDTIKDVLLFEEKTRLKKYDFIIDLDITSPLRTLADLEAAFQLLRDNPDAYNILSVSPPHRNPYFNMVEPKGDGYYKIVKNSGAIKSRQQAPVVYDANASFFIYRRKFFDDGWETGITDKSLIYLVPHLCFDLDNPEDFIIMEILVKENLLNFAL